MSVKVKLRFGSSEDDDPASEQCGRLIGRAEEVFARSLVELVPAGMLPEKVEISLRFESLAQMREYNRKYRGLDEATDVLSFPLWEEEGEFRPGSLPTLPLGDILICPEYVRANTPSEKDFEGEIALMLAHGFLHLLALDHNDDEQKSVMEPLQNCIRDALLASSTDAEEGR